MIRKGERANWSRLIDWTSPPTSSTITQYSCLHGDGLRGPFDATVGLQIGTAHAAHRHPDDGVRRLDGFGCPLYVLGPPHVASNGECMSAAILDHAGRFFITLFRNVATTTRAPSRANASAAARPIPFAAPVTSATFPVKPPVILMSSPSC